MKRYLFFFFMSVLIVACSEIVEEPLFKSEISDVFINQIGSGIAVDTTRPNDDVLGIDGGNKSLSTTCYSFVFSGMTTINGTMYPTVALGDKRWMTMDYSSPVNGTGVIPNVTDTTYFYSKTFSFGRSVLYTPYEFAMSFVDVPSYNDLLAPAGLQVTSGWHLPTKEEAKTLYNYQTGGNLSSSQIYENIVTNMNLDTTGLIYHTKTYFKHLDTSKGYNVWVCDSVKDVPTHHMLDYGVFWTTFLRIEPNGTETWCVAGVNPDRQFATIEHQRYKVRAPIRLVQDIIPLQ